MSPPQLDCSSTAFPVSWPAYYLVGLLDTLCHCSHGNLESVLVCRLAWWRCVEFRGLGCYVLVCSSFCVPYSLCLSPSTHPCLLPFMPGLPSCLLANVPPYSILPVSQSLSQSVQLVSCKPAACRCSIQPYLTTTFSWSCQHGRTLSTNTPCLLHTYYVQYKLLFNKTFQYSFQVWQ